MNGTYQSLIEPLFRTTFPDSSYYNTTQNIILPLRKTPLKACKEVAEMELINSYQWSTSDSLQWYAIKKSQQHDNIIWN